MTNPPTNEDKVTIERAVELMSTALAQHAQNIQQLQQSINSIQPQITDEVTSVRRELADLTQIIKNGLPDPISTTSSPAQTKNTTISPNGTPIPPLLLSNNSTNSESIDIQPPNLTSSTIIVPPISSYPTFSGKSSDRPRQFLLRVVEYTRTVNKWSTDTLLKGISQFLKDSALEWYCQLYITNNIPADWDQFVGRFLAQFHSPLRMAQQEHEWDECKQQENETINEFMVRLRSLWLEQKPEEEESDFIKHLFCKMRTDMLTLMNATRSASLEEIIAEAQQVEEILYLRNKEARSRNHQRYKPTNTTPLLSLNTRNANQTRQYQTATNSMYTPTCWRCYETGHYAPDCPLNDNARRPDMTNNNQQPLPPRSKNT